MFTKYHRTRWKNIHIINIFPPTLIIYQVQYSLNLSKNYHILILLFMIHESTQFVRLFQIMQRVPAELPI